MTTAEMALHAELFLEQGYYAWEVKIDDMRTHTWEIWESLHKNDATCPECGATLRIFHQGQRSYGLCSTAPECGLFFIKDVVLGTIMRLETFLVHREERLAGFWGEWGREAAALPVQEVQEKAPTLMAALYAHKCPECGGETKAEVGTLHFWFCRNEDCGVIYMLDEGINFMFRV